MARPKILVFQHVPYEPLGTLDPLLKEAGFRIRYVNFGRDPHQRPSPDKYEALIVLGGPMNAHQIDTHPNLSTEVEVIREAVDAGMSVLGICLGAQLLAKALGGRVAQNEEREIGWCDVELTEAGRTDPVISSFASTQMQAFRYGDHAYGFQFHLEVNASLVERWLTVPANQPMLAAEAGRVDPETIRQQTKERIGALQKLSRQTFSRWIDRFDIAPRRRTLPSR
jgi:GMP synthase (glutamine-hydrolysing)